MSRTPCTSLSVLLLVAAAVVVFPNSARAQARSPAAKPEPVATPTTAARVPGFLDPEERPDSLRLVPPPPRAGSSAYDADVASYRALRALRDTPRWQVAIADANVQFPHAASTFTCALGVAVTEAGAPHLYRLLQRAMVDAGQSTYLAKDKYQRSRPFAVFDDRMCVPADDKALRKSGAYPSGHASAGWAWALILAEIAPDRVDPILRRGYEFGLSRVVCGVHWMSDVETGRTIAAAAVARLHAQPEFVAQLDLARGELSRLRAAGQPPGLDCDAEAGALSATADF